MERRRPSWLSEDPDRPPSLLDTVGGVLGILEATVPFVAFTVIWTATGRDDILTAGIIAVAISGVLAVARILRRQTTQFALSGVIGVAIGAFVANRTGKAEDFFLPGILLNIGSALVYLTSILIRKPLIGLLVMLFTSEGRRWYQDPERRRLYSRASWVWVGIFTFRFSIQLPLYLTESVGALAVARVVGGLPLFALGVWITYMLIKPLLHELQEEHRRRVAAEATGGD
jgi:hypothetical protein